MSLVLMCTPYFEGLKLYLVNSMVFLPFSLLFLSVSFFLFIHYLYRVPYLGGTVGLYTLLPKRGTLDEIQTPEDIVSLYYEMLQMRGIRVVLSGAS